MWPFTINNRIHDDVNLHVPSGIVQTFFSIASLHPFASGKQERAEMVYSVAGCKSVIVHSISVKGTPTEQLWSGNPPLTLAS